MPTYRELLINTLNIYALNTPNDGYDWNELIEGEWTFNDLSDAQLYVLVLDYLNYTKKRE